MFFCTDFSEFCILVNAYRCLNRNLGIIIEFEFLRYLLIDLSSLFFHNFLLDIIFSEVPSSKIAEFFRTKSLSENILNLLNL